LHHLQTQHGVLMLLHLADAEIAGAIAQVGSCACCSAPGYVLRCPPHVLSCTPSLLLAAVYNNRFNKTCRYAAYNISAELFINGIDGEQQQPVWAAQQQSQLPESAALSLFLSQSTPVTHMGMRSVFPASTTVCPMLRMA
jgi:hypothetical protein